ncbi:MAG: diguanylate cyclase [Myxococcales bacterium]|nr:diguanylate cyclase [Myxococcales bacterium]
MAFDPAHALDAVLSLSARLCRQAPFASGTAELCARVAVLAGARGLSLFALRGTGEIAPLGVYGLGAEYLRRFPADRPTPLTRATGDLREAVQRGEPVLVPRIGDDARTVSLNAVALTGGYATVLACPLLFDGQPVGLVQAFYAQPPAPTRQALLMRVAPILASTLAREQLRLGDAPGHGRGAVDARAEFDRHALRIHAAADRYGQPYSIIVYAIDQPAVLRARYGDALADDGAAQLLRAVEAECRDADVAGRRGDGCCVVALPGTEQRGAFHQCERVLTRFGRQSFRAGDARLQLSASAGVSCFPENGALDADGSLRSAREALEQAVGQDGARVVAIAARGSAAPG